VYQLLPNDAAVLLCIGTAYLGHATSRQVGDRHAAVLKAFAFFQRYAERAPNRQEAAYNVARAAHQLALPHLAKAWYERALLLGGGYSGEAGVTFEAGHNLACIYEASGALELALRVRAAYCTV
jgi:general transcription factor 3C polypeptide 3 (transcription factor C subunit 4)